MAQQWKTIRISSNAHRKLLTLKRRRRQSLADIVDILADQALTDQPLITTRGRSGPLFICTVPAAPLGGN